MASIVFCPKTQEIGVERLPNRHIRYSLSEFAHDCRRFTYRESALCNWWSREVLSLVEPIARQCSRAATFNSERWSTFFRRSQQLMFSQLATLVREDFLLGLGPISESRLRSVRFSSNRRPQPFYPWQHVVATNWIAIQGHAIFDELPFWHRRWTKERSLLRQETLAFWCRSFSPCGDSSN